MKSDSTERREIAMAKWTMIKAAFLRWTEKTTVHGFLSIFDSSNHFIIRLIWIPCLLACVSFCFVLMIESITSFCAFDTSSLIKVERVSNNMEFPEIVVCNWNKFATLAGAAYILNQTRGSFGQNISSFGDLSHEQYVNYDLFLSRRYARTLSSSFNKSLRDSFSYTHDQMVISCLFNLQPCDHEWESFYHTKYGSCLRWNSAGSGNGGVSNQSVKTQSKPSEGLHLQLYIGAPQTDTERLFWMCRNQASGIYLAILNQSWIFHPQEIYNIKPGTWTDIALSRTFVENIPYPYSECQDTDHKHWSSIIDQMKQLGVTYRQKDCLDLCDQAYIIKRCGCYDFDKENIFHAECCSNWTEQECLLNQTLPYLREVVHAPGCLASCPVECKSLTYDVYQSQSTFPSRSYAHYMMYDKKIIDNFKKDNVTLNYENLVQSVIGLNIYYDDLEYTIITTSPVMTIVGLISNVGGVIGLFLGMSLLSLVELVELSLKIIFIVLRKLDGVKRIEEE